MVLKNLIRWPGNGLATVGLVDNTVATLASAHGATLAEQTYYWEHQLTTHITLKYYTTLAKQLFNKTLATKSYTY